MTILSVTYYNRLFEIFIKIGKSCEFKIKYIYNIYYTKSGPPVDNLYKTKMCLMKIQQSRSVEYMSFAITFRFHVIKFQATLLWVYTYNVMMATT